MAWRFGPPPALKELPTSYSERWVAHSDGELPVGVAGRAFVWRGGAPPTPYRDGAAALTRWAAAHMAAATGWEVTGATSIALDNGTISMPLMAMGETVAVMIAGAARRVRWGGGGGSSGGEGGEVELRHGDVLVMAEEWRAGRPLVTPMATSQRSWLFQAQLRAPGAGERQETFPSLRTTR